MLPDQVRIDLLAHPHEGLDERVPISLPNNRAVWVVAAMAAACAGVMFAMAKVMSAVIAIARPTASTICEGRKSPFAQSSAPPWDETGHQV